MAYRDTEGVHVDRLCGGTFYVCMLCHGHESMDEALECNDYVEQLADSGE